MKNKYRIAVVLLIIGCLFASACRGRGERAFPTEVQRKLEQAVLKNLADFGGETSIPGAIVGVWMPDKGSWVRGIGTGDVELNRPPMPADHVRIGSNTKTFVVTVLLQLVEEGKLSLDDTLKEFHLGVNIPNADRITLRQLCNMTGGLFEAYEVEELEPLVGNPIVPVDPLKVVRMAAAYPPLNEPGVKWQYNNTGYLILGLVIEKVTGRSIADVIRARILQPLELTQTSFPTDYSGMPCPYLHGYAPGEKGEWTDVSVFYPPTLSWAAGAMISDVQDMKKWVKAYVTGTTNSAATQRERLTCIETGRPNAQFGLGVGCTGGWYGYTGGIMGYNTSAFYLPEKDATIIVFVNAQMEKPSPGVANSIVHDISAIITPEHVVW